MCTVINKFITASLSMLTSASSPIKVQVSQILHEKDHTISSGRFQRISLLGDDVAGFENSRSLATDVDGIQRYVRAAAATPGNLLACLAHQANGDDV